MSNHETDMDHRCMLCDSRYCFGECAEPCDHAADPIYWIGPNSPDEDWQSYCLACDEHVTGRDDEYDGAPCCRAQVTAGTMSGEHEPGCGGG